MQVQAESRQTQVYAKNRATQIKRWREILEALKDFLIGVVNLEFRPDGVQLLAMDASNTALAYLLLEAGGFVEYSCQVRQSIGLKITDLLKAIKAMSSADDMTFIIPQDSLQLCIVGKDEHKQTAIEFTLPSLTTDSRRFRIPHTEWGRTIQIPTKDFKSYITTLANTGADVLAIEWRQGVLSLSAAEDTIRARISVSTVEKDIPESPDDKAEPSPLPKAPDPTPVDVLSVPKPPQIEPLYGDHEQAAKRQRLSDLPSPVSPPFVAPSNVPNFARRFELKYMGYFTKAEPLNAVVRVLLRHDYPLCLTYEITEWGQLTFCLNPKIDEDEEDLDEAEFNEFGN